MERKSAIFIFTLINFHTDNLISEMSLNPSFTENISGEIVTLAEREIVFNVKLRGVRVNLENCDGKQLVVTLYFREL